MHGWAIDLGTTNTGVAAWDSTADQPVVVELPAICRRPEAHDPLEAPRLPVDCALAGEEAGRVSLAEREPDEPDRA